MNKTCNGIFSYLSCFANDFDSEIDQENTFPIFFQLTSTISPDMNKNYLKLISEKQSLKSIIQNNGDNSQNNRVRFLCKHIVSFAFLVSRRGRQSCETTTATTAATTTTFFRFLKLSHPKVIFIIELFCFS